MKRVNSVSGFIDTFEMSVGFSQIWVGHTLVHLLP